MSATSPSPASKDAGTAKSAANADTGSGANSGTNRGTVIAVFGRRFEIETDAGVHLDCVTRGKKNNLACGDRVFCAVTGPGQGIINQVLPRRNYLERSDAYKQKSIAANVDQVLVLAAVEPRASEEFITRVLLIAHAANVPALIVLNKIDMAGCDAARARLDMFEAAGHDIITLTAKPRDGSRPSAEEALLARLLGKCTVLAGQSGMGKSSLINALVPGAAAVIGELSAALKAGKHTTTFSRLYRIDVTSTIIDCPGMQEVGIHHLHQANLEAGFHEFAPYLGTCRFANCRHLHEPNCPVRAAASTGVIHPERFALYQKLTADTGA